MVRRLGPYAPLAATYAADDAIIEAGEEAELLFLRGLAFCAASESDGFITRAQLKRFVGAGMDNVMQRAERLVEVGLWEEEESGFLVRAWLKWNASAEELGRARKKDRERKAAKKTDTFHSDRATDSDAESTPDSDDLSARNPDGIQTEGLSESSGIPGGFQPHAGARAGDSLNLTSLNENPPTPPGGTRGRSRAEITRKFDDFWSAYPRKVGKDAARRAWEKAIKSGADPDDVIAGARAYVRDPTRRTADIKFTAHPATWLSQGRWTDEAATAQSAASGGWWNN